MAQTPLGELALRTPVRVAQDDSLEDVARLMRSALRILLREDEPPRWQPFFSVGSP